MTDNCLCEDCDNKKVLRHFEKCGMCGSEAYHSTPRLLNQNKHKPKDESRHVGGVGRK